MIKTVLGKDERLLRKTKRQPFLEKMNVAPVNQTTSRDTERPSVQTRWAQKGKSSSLTTEVLRSNDGGTLP